MHAHNGKYTSLAVMFLLAILLTSNFAVQGIFSQAQGAPLYARVGAYALYDVQGGAVAFFDGVQGNISYTVTSVFTNGSMRVGLWANITQGSEIPPTTQFFDYTDSIQSPKVFPVIPISELGSPGITFENTSLSYVKSLRQEVGAGTFQTLEYQGTNNGTTVSFYFDNATGLAIYELSETGSVISLISSNIANPLSVPDPVSTDLPYILIFVIIFAGSGVGYFEITRYYAKQARRDFKKKLKRERMKERRSAENSQ